MASGCLPDSVCLFTTYILYVWGGLRAHIGNILLGMKYVNKSKLLFCFNRPNCIVISNVSLHLADVVVATTLSKAAEQLFQTEGISICKRHRSKFDVCGERWDYNKGTFCDHFTRFYIIME